MLCPWLPSLGKLVFFLRFPCVAYKTTNSLDPPLRLRWPKLKRTSRLKRCRDISISLRLLWTSQWESAVALESDDPRCCIFSHSAKNYLASRSCPASSRLYYLLVSSAYAVHGFSRESISSVYAVVIPVRPLFASTSSFAQSTGIHILTLSSVHLCAARAARVVFNSLYYLSSVSIVIHYIFSSLLILYAFLLSIQFNPADASFYFSYCPHSPVRQYCVSYSVEVEFVHIHSCFLSFHASGISIKWPSHHGYALAVPVVMVSSSISSGFNFRSACSASLQNFGSFSFSCFKSSGVVRKMAPLPSALSLAIHWSKISFHSLFVASL